MKSPLCKCKKKLGELQNLNREISVAAGKLAAENMDLKKRLEELEKRPREKSKKETPAKNRGCKSRTGKKN